MNLDYHKYQLVFLTSLIVLSSVYSEAQGIFIPRNDKNSRTLSEFGISNNENNFASEIFPYTTGQLSEINVSPKSRYGIWTESYLIDNVSNKIYNDKEYFYRYYGKESFITVNPIIALEIGNQEFFTNSRGFEVSGRLSDKVSFYSSYIENQFTFPTYIKEYIANAGNVVPGIGRFRTFNGEFVPYKVTGFDASFSEGYLNVEPIKDVLVSFGRNSHFIGNGHRSLLLSDFSNPYLNLSVSAKIWKFTYKAIFAEFLNYPNALSVPGHSPQIRKKHGAFHYMSTGIGKRVRLGVFEGVIFNRGDSTTQSRFDMNYLNPVIFYRSVEYHLGSPDNMLFGANLSIDFAKRYQFYSQLMFDEFNVSFLLKRNSDWWANKYGFQFGVKGFDIFGFKNLDGLIELNQVRPYTYSHWSYMGAYSNNGVPLAHPLGSNFRETMFKLDYDISNNLKTSIITSIYIKGLDSNAISYGGDILRSYYDRPSNNFGHILAQGDQRNVINSSFLLSYNWKSGVYLDYSSTFRRSDNSKEEDQILFHRIGIRMNINYRFYDY